MQDQRHRCLAAVWTVPVQVEKVAIGQPQALAPAGQQGCLSAKGRPESLQVWAGQPPGGSESIGHGALGKNLRTEPKVYAVAEQPTQRLHRTSPPRYALRDMASSCGLRTVQTFFLRMPTDEYHLF